MVSIGSGQSPGGGLDVPDQLATKDRVSRSEASLARPRCS